MAELNPYLNFADNCEEVFNFYKSVFGGEFLTLMRFGEMPAEYQPAEGESQKLMHVALPIGKHTVLMGSDTPGNMPTPVKGRNFSIAIQPETEEEAKRIFDGLSEGGNITMPLSKTFWSKSFGMFTDKFGIDWMVNLQ
ncbi:PhnB protein [Pedobacter steynii]|uniref:PhnB protein n=1 Tax=Pedobacter steynii TaxID=430522 RepID=A0A1G9L4R0_9SPHI|nr:VOC family protein [Pedobacter steynii]NQX38740.1 VOC family protein [Pedobacter steynii]SDL57008.1 PhnB protein [Pedobacter steynii]